MSEQTNISPKKKPVATDELSEEALDQVAGGPASQPSTNVKINTPIQGAEVFSVPVGDWNIGRPASSPKTPF